MEMNNQVRQKLIELMGNDGQELLLNNRKLSGLLLDHCPEHRKEIRAILTAREEQIPEELIKAKTDPTKEIIIARLTQKLLNLAPMADEAARWAIETWALALNVITVSDLGIKEEANSPGLSTKKIDISTVMTPGLVLIVSRLGLGQYKSINEAIQAAAPNTRILVKAGLYKETLILNKSLEIVGDGLRDEIVIEADNCLQISQDFKGQIRFFNLIFRGSIPITSGQIEIDSCVANEKSYKDLSVGGIDTKLVIKASYIHCVDHGSRSKSIISIIDCDIKFLKLNEKSYVSCVDSKIEKVRFGELNPINSILQYENHSQNKLPIDNSKKYAEFKNCQIQKAYIREGITHFLDCKFFASQDSVLIDNFDCLTIENRGSGIFLKCIFKPYRQTAIAITGNGGPIFKNCTISGGFQNSKRPHNVNVYGPHPNPAEYNISSSRKDLNNCGIFWGEDTEGTIEDSLITGNKIGIEIIRGGNPVIRNCKIVQNSFFGILVHNNGAGLIENCDLRDNSSGAWSIEIGCPVRRNNNLE